MNENRKNYLFAKSGSESFLKYDFDLLKALAVCHVFVKCLNDIFLSVPQ